MSIVEGLRTRSPLDRNGLFKHVHVQTCRELLLDNREALDKLSIALLEKETVTAEEFAQILTESQVTISDYKVFA